MSLFDLLDNNVILGEDSLQELEQIIVDKNYMNLLLVSGNSSFQLTGADLFFESLADKIKIHHLRYSGNALDVEEVNEFSSRIKSIGEIDLIIGIGGGSILDLTKLLSLLYSNDLSSADSLISESDFKNRVDLILIPTTAGSGSESTSFAVLYKSNNKYSVSSKDLNVTKIILDPSLLNKIPDHILKISILDSLSQAIESFWSINSTELSRSYAESAIKILSKNLTPIPNYENMKDFLVASHLSGKAINISKTTAPHALSYSLTSLYSIPHGFAVAFFLIELIKFNYEVDSSNCSDKRGSDHVQSQIEDILKYFKLEQIRDFQKFLNSILFEVSEDYNEKINNIDLNDLLKNIVQYINVERLANNPRTINNSELEKLISASFESFNLEFQKRAKIS